MIYITKCLSSDAENTRNGIQLRRIKIIFGIEYAISVAYRNRTVNLDRRLRNTVFRHLANIVPLRGVEPPKTFLRARNFVSRSCRSRPLGSSFPGGELSRSSCRRVHRSITLCFSKRIQYHVDKASRLSAMIVMCVRSHSSPHLLPPATINESGFSGFRKGPLSLSI